MFITQINSSNKSFIKALRPTRSKDCTSITWSMTTRPMDNLYKDPLRICRPFPIKIFHWLHTRQVNNIYTVQRKFWFKYSPLFDRKLGCGLPDRRSNRSWIIRTKILIRKLIHFTAGIFSRSHHRWPQQVWTTDTKPWFQYVTECIGKLCGE